MSFGINYPKHFCRTQPNFLWGGGGGGDPNFEGGNQQENSHWYNPIPFGSFYSSIFLFRKFLFILSIFHFSYCLQTVYQWFFPIFCNISINYQRKKKKKKRLESNMIVQVLLMSTFNNVIIGLTWTQNLEFIYYLNWYFYM